MQKLSWFERIFKFDLTGGVLPFYIERLQGTIPRIENKVKGISEEKLSQKHDNHHLVRASEILSQRLR